MKSKQVYQLKITLSDIIPSIWRRVEVPPDASLCRFAAVIIGAMGWHGGHLHQFRMGRNYYGLPNKNDLTETADEREVTLGDIVEKKGIKTFIFEYDFGDGWEHAVVFEKAQEPQKGVKYPRCTAGGRNCPPEDCGGPPGYEDFLRVIGDPKHPEHDDMKKWAGGDFDPEAFDLENVSDLAEVVEELEEQWAERWE